MHMISMRGAFQGIGAGLLAILCTAGPAQPAPMATTTASAAPGICATGFRGQPDYDRLCLITGTAADAGIEWFTTYPTADRKAQCRTARRTSMASVVTETRGDMITDRYRNDATMLRLVTRMGARECTVRWGIRL